MTKVNREIVKEILEKMPQNKKETLGKTLDRNLILTSARVLGLCEMTIYKEGWLVELTGTRCKFTVFAKDNDGEFEFIRKPNKDKLHKLYNESCTMNEDDYSNF